MTTATAATDLPAGRFYSSTLPGVSHPKPVRQVSTVINQPLDTVAAYLRSSTSCTGRSHWRVGPDLRGDAGVLGPVGRRSLYPVRRAGRLAGDGIDRRPAPQALRPHDGHCSPGHQPAHRGPSLGDAGLPRIAQRVSGAIPCVSHETVQMKEV